MPIRRRQWRIERSRHETNDNRARRARHTVLCCKHSWRRISDIPLCICDAWRICFIRSIVLFSSALALWSSCLPPSAAALLLSSSSRLCVAPASRVLRWRSADSATDRLFRTSVLSEDETWLHWGKYQFFIFDIKTNIFVFRSSQSSFSTLI